MTLRNAMVGSGLVVGLVAGFGLLALTGCETHQKTESTLVVTHQPAQIEAETLSNHGLEELWYDQPETDGSTVSGAYLNEAGLIVCTYPTETRPGRVKLFKLSDGFPKWHFNIDYPVKHEPGIYRYATKQSGRPDECFILQLDTVHCLDLEYGAQLWKTRVPFPVSTGISASEGFYFAGSDNGRAYGTEKGRPIDAWTYRTNGDVRAAPVSHGTGVIVASTDGSVYRFTAAAGWQRDKSWRFRTSDRLIARPAVFASWVLVGSTDYKLYCLHAGNGALFWSFPVEAPIEDDPVVYSYRTNQEFVYCIGVDRSRSGVHRTLFSVNLKNGKLQWRLDGVRKVVSIGRRNLYVLTDPESGEGRSLMAVDVLKGKERFRIPLSERMAFIPTNSADKGRAHNRRGRFYIVSVDGAIQAIGEK